VLDFGVSKLESADALTVDGVLLGTPSFMSPEQAKGRGHVDARSDVFSAGILFYLMLDGANPFEDASFASVVDAIVRREVPPLHGLPPPVWSVLHQALEKDPALRFNDATEMGIALRRAAGRKSTTESNPILPVAPSSSRSSLVPRAAISVAPDSSRSLSGPAPAHESPAAMALEDARRRRRAIVAGVMGIAAALVLAAVVVAMPGSPLRAAPASAAQASAPAAIPVPEPGPPEAPATPAPAVAPPPVSTVAAPAVPQRAPSARPTAAPKHVSTGSAVSRGRKPGQEPHNARDPGF
jgi:serine/threonine-protein kinase